MSPVAGGSQKKKKNPIKTTDLTSHSTVLRSFPSSRWKTAAVLHVPLVCCILAEPERMLLLHESMYVGGM